ncbi:hypothetical protein N7456_012144 [Penicillium angulare]|uniref:NAD(P)-binding protein n=1 Tax=Penicillium angulare TaxID=116970 RepID=A0A9W9K0F8_9EURO|nr:hypothetical protein N7456_012144 [Penicillium angulare]
MASADWTKPLAYIGLTTVAYTTFKLLRGASIYLHPSTLTKEYNPTGKNWALVTGATDGIGFGFCQELRARGFNVILHGRNETKLQKRAKELEAEFPATKTSIIVLDVVGVTNAIDEVGSQVRETLARNGGELSVLVNNVGGDSKPYTMLEAYTFEEAQETLDKNAVFMLQITRVLLPVLEAGRRGIVLNVSSISAYGMPFISVYSASKGFVDTLTRALEAECVAEGRNVDVMGLRVGPTRTSAFDVKAGLFVPNSRELAIGALNRVGCGEVIAWAYFWHSVQGVMFDVMPRSVLMKITAKKMRELKKEEEEKAKKR